MPRPEWRDPSKEKRWRRLLKQWRRSGLTGRDFCAALHLSEASFYAWKREIAQRDREKSVQTPVATRRSSDRRSAPTPLPAFMPVTLEAAASAETALEVVLLHGRVLRVRPGFDADELRRLLTVLEAPSC